MTAKEAFRQAMRTEDEIKIQLARFIERQKGEFSPHTYRAAELLKAQIEAYQNAVAIADHSANPGGDILWKQRECQDELAKLEAPGA